MADREERGGLAADTGGCMDAAAQESWALPAWGASSASCASDWSGADAWSDVEADVSVETSSVDSTQHQRVYREQRARRRPGEGGDGSERAGRDLREIHRYYLEQRRLAEQTSSAADGQGGAQASDASQEKLAEQQAGVQAELKAVRRQLSSFQEKWGASANAAEASATAVTQRSVDQPHTLVDVHEAKRLDSAVERDAARQWLLMLAQKVQALAQDYAHGPSQSFFATVAHLTGLKGSDLDQRPIDNVKTTRTVESEPVLLQGSGWDGLKAMASPDMAEQILALERAITQLTECVRGHSTRQLACFDQSIRQLQAFHNARVQRVVDESLEELKLVRGRYRKKTERLEAELRSASQSVREWQEKVKHAEHRQQAAMHQLADANAQMETDRKQYEADLLRVRELLESACAEKEEELGRRQSDHEAASVSLEQTRAQVSELQMRCKALIAQQASAKELYDLENLTLRQTIGDLREQLANTQSEHGQEKQRLEDEIAALERRLRDELDQLEARVKEETRAEVMEAHLPSRVREVERRYADDLQAFQRKHNAHVAELTTRIEQATASVAPTLVHRRTIETQTDEAIEASTPGQDAEDKRVEDLTRKCRALEKLLNKKFEDASESMASSRLCASCHSDSAPLRLSAASPAGQHQQPHRIEKSKALARALLSSSRSSLEDALFPDAADGDDTMATEEQTTMNAADMWDSASFTSLDSVDDASSLRPLPPRAPSAQAPSTQEMAALARKLKRFAAKASASSTSVSSSHREPDPELSSDARGIPRRNNANGRRAPSVVSSRDTKASPSDRRLKVATTGFSSFDDLLQSISSRRTSPQ